MQFYETRMEGSHEAFPETSWGTILSCSDPDSTDRHERLNRLFRQYWRPVFAFIRSKWGKSIEESKDLTQGFFCHVLETNFISKSDRTKGRFRSFVRAALSNYLAESHRSDRALKRGAGVSSLSLETLELPEDDSFIDSTLSPEEIFDLQWANAVLKQGLSRLQESLIQDGKEEAWKVYEAYEIQPSTSNEVTYQDLARTFELSESQVKSRLDLARERLHGLILKTVAESVASPVEMTAEMNELPFR